MPPTLDIYILTHHRTRETIEQFLAVYTNRVAVEDRGDEELMLHPIESDLHEYMRPDVEWEPALTLTHTIERGLSYPRRAFTVYCHANKPPITQAILSFTRDNKLILGLALDDTGINPSQAVLARTLLTELATSYPTQLGLITTEQAPPLDEPAFHALGTHPLTLVSKTFE
jgi:hypothetical protein